MSTFKTSSGWQYLEDLEMTNVMLHITKANMWHSSLAGFEERLHGRQN